TNTITITSTDGAATLPPDAALVGGTKDFTLTLNTVGVWTITASNVGGPPPTAGTSASITAASITITPATGGGAISADDSTSGAWTALTGPLYGEAASANVGTGTIIMNAPSGFIFDVGGTAPTVLVTRIAGAGANSRNINAVASGTSLAITSISTTQITFTVTSSSNTGVTNSLTWQNVRVRPNISYPLATGDITKSGTASMVGVTNGSTNFGTLTEILGAPKSWSGLGDGISWNDPANWSPAGVPTGSNDVTIGANTINVNISTLAHDVTINNASANVTIPAGISLSVTNNFAQSNGTFNIATAFPTVIGTTSITGGTIGYTDAGAQSIALQTYNNLVLSGSGVKTFASGTTNITGDLTFGGSASADAITNTTTINYNGSGAQVVGAMDYYDVALANAGTKTFASGISRIANTFTIGGTASADAITNSATIEYNGAGTQTVNAINYHHLTLATSGTKTFAAGTTGIAGVLSLTGSAAADATTNSATILYNGAGAQNVNAISYHHLTLATSGVKSFVTGTTTVAGTLSITGTATADASANGTTVDYNGSGPQSILAFNYYNLTSSSSGARTLASSGTIGVAGTFTKGSNLYTVTGSTIDYNGTGAQNVIDFTYNNLTISGTGTSTLLGTATVAGDLTISGGTFDLTSFAANRTSPGGTLTIAAICTLRIGGVGTSLPTNYTTHAFDPTSKIEYYGTNQLLPAGTYDNLNISGAGTTVTLGASISIIGDLTITDGTLDLSTFTANRTTSGGTLSVGSGGTLIIGGTNPLPVNYTTVTLDPASTVEYAGTSHTIAAVQYGDLTVSSSGAITLQSSGTIGIAGTFTAGTGTYTTSGSTVDFNNATGGQTIPAIDYYNLTISNTSGVNTLVGTVGVSNLFTPSAGALTSAGTSTVDFNNATGGQSIPAFNYYNLTISNTSGVNTLVGTINVSNIFSPSAGALTSAGTSTMVFNGSGAQTIPAMTYYNLTLSGAADTSAANAKTAAGTIIVSNILTIDAGNTFEMSSYSSSSFGGSSVNSGKIKWSASNAYVPGTGVTEFYGSSATTVAPGTNYGNILITGSGTMTVSGAVTATGGDASVGVTVSSNLTISGTGVLTITGMDLNNDGIITNNGTINVP
ncbi:MAG: hypothetical protein WCW40_00250, partial [Bacteroidota bacterium]